MAEFGLSQLRQLLLPARRPDHPMGDLAEAQALLAGLESKDSLAAFAEATNWLQSFGPADGFSPGRRARVLLLINDAVRVHWRELAHQYLAPDEEPSENKDGDPELLHSMMGLSDGLAAGLSACFDAGMSRSAWLERNAPLVMVRWMRALARRASLRRMLRLPPDEGVWPTMHAAYLRAVKAKVEGKPVAAYADEGRLSSIRQEYVRAALFDLASPDSLKVRHMELVYRIAGRFAASVQLVDARTAATVFGIDTASGAGPALVDRLPPAGALLYLDTANCIAQMVPFAESLRGGAPGAPDTAFGTEYTVRESNAMLKHTLACWGAAPPQRKAARVRLGGQARVSRGFASVVANCQPCDQGGWSRSEGTAAGLKIELGDTKADEQLALVRASREIAAKLTDASPGGLGLSVALSAGSWAHIGVLVCVHAEAGGDWSVGTIRRVRAGSKALDLGVQVYSRRPKVAWLRWIAVERESVWQDAMIEERSFDDHFLRAIVLGELPQAPGSSVEMILGVRRVKPGMGLLLPMAGGMTGLRVRDVLESNDDYARIRVEWRALQQRPAG